MLSIFFISTTFLIICLFGVFIYLSNPENQANRYFSISTGFLALWVIVNFLQNEPTLIGHYALRVFLRLDFALAVTFFFVWFAFCYSFALKPFTNLEKFKVIFLLSLSTLILAFLSVFSETILTNITFDGLIHFERGPLWFLYATNMIVTVLGSLMFLYLGKRNAVKQKNFLLAHQINIIFLGFFLALGNAILINLFLQAFFPISLEISRFGIYGLTIFVALTSYAITRYHFFDIKLTLIRTFSFFILSLGVTICYAYVLNLGMAYMFGMQSDSIFLAVSTILTTLVALSFHPLQKKVAELTNRLLHKSYYDSEKLLAELTHIMASNINIDAMTKSLLLTLKSSLHLTDAAFLVYKKNWSFDLKTSAIEKGDFSFSAQQAQKLDELYKQGYFCSAGKRMCRFQDLEEGPAKQFFREQHISLIIPVRVNHAVIALLVLGDKKSGEVYTVQDLEFFDIFSDEVGIAIQNTQSYKEITEFNALLEKRVQERTQQLQKVQRSEIQKALDVAKLKDEFVFVATHELRAPITAIKLFLEMASSEGEHVPEKLKSHLESMHEASDHLNQLIDDLLEIARSESGTLHLTVQAVNLIAVIKQVVHELHSLAENRNITISYNNDLADIFVEADENKLKEVVTNLISNAIKYNKENGSISISFIENEGTITTEIHDTGYGIPENVHGSIFDKFFRAINKDTEEVVGTGLGLFISRMLLEKMGGMIKFSSVESMGSTFAFSLKRSHT